MISNFNKLSAAEKVDYNDLLRVKNKIICSYSRYTEFVAAQQNVLAAAKYEIEANPWCKHECVFLFDEEGFMSTFYINDEEGVMYVERPTST